MSVLIIVFLLLAMLLTVARRIRLRRYTTRGCQGRAWKSAFPAASNEEIRLFLDAFADAFGFSSKQRLCFAPNDKVDEVYRTIYSPGEADALEHVQLMMNLESIYGEIPEEVMAVSTLGQLFEAVRKKNENGA